MKFYSTTTKSHEVSGKEAIVAGLAPDGGLYMPKEIPALKKETLDNLSETPIHEVAFQVANRFLSEDIPEKKLREIVEETLSFEIPLVTITDDIHSLELFHGPTLAFKDVGARFMARTMSYFREGNEKELTILVATSGDTGSAVAHGFLNVPGINVVLLYPSGQVSEIQEKQFTTLGNNITALEVAGTFDDCQRLVKEAFVDEDLRGARDLSSANSINIARLIPQSFYYFHGCAQVQDHEKPLAFCIPSGNFGNLTAGLFAKRMGLPIERFVAATNINDIVPEYLETGEFNPRPSKQTISNAMDVGNPSNFARMAELYGSNLGEMKKDIFGTRFSDEQTKATIKEVKEKHDYLLDPHGAVGYLGLQSFLEREPNYTGILLETAHPAKFIDTVEESIGSKIEIPKSLQEVLTREKIATSMTKDFSSFKEFLLS